ncbi:MAG: thioredoxin [Spirochaetota bacterium]
MVKEIENPEQFENTVLKYNGMSVVDFWAGWCGPCKALSPVFDRLSEKYSAVNFVKVNVEQNQAVAARFSVNALPTILFLKNGKVVQQITGSATESKITESLTKNMA